MPADDRFCARSHCFKQTSFFFLDSNNDIKFLQRRRLFIATNFNPMWVPAFFETFVSEMQYIVRVDDALDLRTR